MLALWAQRTREELRETLSSEVKSLRRAQQLAADNTIEWNHLEFEVAYASLETELRVGEVYLRLLLDGAPKTLEMYSHAERSNPRTGCMRLVCLACSNWHALACQAWHAPCARCVPACSD